MTERPWTAPIPLKVLQRRAEREEPLCDGELPATGLTGDRSEKRPARLVGVREPETSHWIGDD